MEKRTLEISLETAQKWFRDGGELKELALQVYKEYELRPKSYQDIVEESNSYRLSVLTTDSAALEVNIIAKLLTIAKILNGNWIPEVNKNKFFIAPLYFYGKNGAEWQVRKHDTVMYPGIAYFKSEELAHKAIAILKNELEYLK